MRRTRSTRHFRAAIAAVPLLCAVLFFGLVATAEAGVITYWSSYGPKGTVGANMPVTAKGSSSRDGYALLPSSAKLTIDSVVIPPSSYNASILTNSAYFYYNPQPKLTDGPHTFRVEVSDARGAVSAKEWGATVVQPPSAGWFAPAAGGTDYTGSPSIVMSLADNTPGPSLAVVGQVHEGTANGPVVATFGGAGLSPGQATFTLANELSPGIYYLTATVIDAAGNSLVLDGLAARSFSTVAAPAMTVLTKCLDCHPTYPTAHPTYATSSCVMCHLGYDTTHPEGTTDCVGCHGRDLHPTVAVGPSCTDCHTGGLPAYRQHTAESVAPSHLASCSGCHQESLLTRHVSTPAGSVYSSQCDVCHGSTDATVTAAIASGDTRCSGCHDGHGDLTALHTFTALEPGCQGEGCHVDYLPDAHAAFTGEGNRYPQYPDSCSLCHDNDDPERVPDTATADCSTCHGELGAGHLTMHSTTTSMSVLAGTGTTCGDCHDANMVTEHAKPTASSAAPGCVACHPSPRDTIVTHDDATCAQAGCHVPASGSAMHGDIAAGHALPVPAPSCAGADCHAGADLAEFHSQASTTTASGTRTGCLVCHSGSSIPASGSCASCHAGYPEAYHGDLAVQHTAPVTCLDTCHSPRLDTEHAAQGLTCAACHDSANATVRNAIDTGQTVCSVCHGPDHAATSSFCTGCHTSPNGTYAGPSTYALTKHGTVASSTKAAVRYPGTTYAAGACANCHGRHSATTRSPGNQLCYDCHDAAGTTKPTTYSYQGSTRYALSAHNSPATCATCHAVHGATDTAGFVTSGLKKREPAGCTGTTLQPGCHASGANARNGTNILAAFTTGVAPSTHHDTFTTSAGKIVCSNCHNPHTDTATNQFANPAAIGTPLPNASDRFRDADGRMYALVGAMHDGIPPVMSQITTSPIVLGDPTQLYAWWRTDEPSNGYVDYGQTTAYGTTVNSMYVDYVFHRAQPLNFAMGTTWHYRLRSVDRLGNTSVTQDYTYRVPYTQLLSGPTVTGGASLSPVTVTWKTRGDCDTWVDYGPTTSYGSTAGSSSYVSTHTVTLDLPAGTWHLRARSARDIDSYVSGDMVVTVYPGYATAATLTPVPSNYNIGGPQEISFQWSQPNTTYTPFTYQLHVWDANSSPTYDYVSPWLSSNTATLSLDGDHNYNWTVQAKDKDGTLYPISAVGTFSLYYYSGGSGSCPFLFTWDGEKFAFESDEFAAGKLGLNTSKGFRKPNPYDYHVLATEPAVKDGALEYKLVEERAEVDYLDQVKLYTVEAPAEKEVWVERSQAEGAGMFTSLNDVIHTTERGLDPPVKVTHVNTGQDVTAKIAAKDGDYLMLNEDRNVDYDYQTIELDLGDVQDAPMTKLVIDGRTCIPTSIAGRQRSLLFGPQVRFEVQDAAGAWKAVPTTNTILPKPPEFERPFVLDLSNIWISDSRKVRFTYLYKTYFDAILLDTSADVPVKLTEVPLESAKLEPHGFDGKSTLQELYDFVYGDIVSPPYYHLPGNYTKFGTVDPLLSDIDDKFVIFGGGDELTLRFTPPAPVPANTNRRFMFVSDGYYKDLKQTIAHTVDPLPFAAMSNFPYAETEHYPDDADHQAYLAEWNTRYEDGAASTQEPGPLSSLLDTVGGLWRSFAAKVVSLFAPEPDTARFASHDVPDDTYSVDTDRVSMNVVYAGSSTPVYASAGWQSASAESVKPTPSLPGTAVDPTTLSNAASSNNQYWRTDLTTTNGYYNWQVMRFDVAANLLTNAKGLQLQWEGHGEPTTGHWVKAYLWDFQASRWVLASEAWGGADFELQHVERQAGLETFCLTCHTAAPPAGASGAASFVNMNTAWDLDFHGEGVSAGTGAALKAPYVRGNVAIPCDTCHDSHGSGNLFHINGSINASSGITVSNGVDFQNACKACHEGTVAQFHQQCDGCHYGEHGWGPTINESYDCSSCHRHGGWWVHQNIGCHCGDLPQDRSF